MKSQSKNDHGNVKKQAPTNPEKKERIDDDKEVIDPAKIAESTSPAEKCEEIDKLIGRGLKLPHVQSDGLW